MALTQPIEQAASQIMEKVSTFANLIQRSAMMSVGWWTDKELENAFQWAAYCQQVAKQIEGWKELQEGLEKKMTALNGTMKPPLPVPLSLNFIRFGMDILLEALVCNPTVTESLLHMMRDLVTTKYQQNIATEIYKKEVAEVIRAYANRTEQALHAVEKELRQIPADSSETMPGAGVENLMQTLLETLACWLEASGSHRIWFEYRLCLVLHRLSRCQLGWPLLVSSLGIDLGKLELGWRDAMRKLLHLVLAWMAFQFRNEGTACAIWQVSPLVMAKAAEQCHAFLGWYLARLEDLGTQLETECNSLCAHTNQPAISSMSKIHEEFIDLVMRFCHLLTMDKEAKNMVMMFLCSKTKGKVFNLWTDLTSRVINHFAA